MKNHLTVRLAINLIVFCLFIAGAARISAQQTENDADANDFPASPCERFPKESVFDSFEKAFASPAEVRCLQPAFEGGDLNMKRLPKGLGRLVNLEVFSFACLESLEALPEEIGNLTKLEELIIDNGNGCSMSVSLPASIGKLENLRVLRLYGALESTAARKIVIPASIANLRKLEILDLGRNGLSSVPPAIAALSNLKTLRLEYNNLRSVPAFVGEFKNLTELVLDANEKISVLPASFAKRRGLSVSLGNNALKLKAQQTLRTRFPGIVFSFTNEYDDERANEEPAQKKKS